MITKRTLELWRRQAFVKRNNPLMKATGEGMSLAIIEEREYCDRILRLTQELLDIELMRKG